MMTTIILFLLLTLGLALCWARWMALTPLANFHDLCHTAPVILKWWEKTKKKWPAICQSVIACTSCRGGVHSLHISRASSLSSISLMKMFSHSIFLLVLLNRPPFPSVLLVWYKSGVPHTDVSAQMQWWKCAKANVFGMEYINVFKSQSPSPLATTAKVQCTWRSQ